MKKRVIVLMLLCIVSLMLSIPSFAAVVTFGSGGGTGGYGTADPIVGVDWPNGNTSKVTAIINKNSDWADPVAGTRWVSSTIDGWSGSGEWNTGNKTFKYFVYFDIPANAYSPKLRIIYNADDRGDGLYINGHKFGESAQIDLPTRKTCIVDDPSFFNIGASNKLEIWVYNGGSQTGLDFSAELTYDDIGVNITTPTLEKEYYTNKNKMTVSGELFAAGTIDSVIWQNDRGGAGNCVIGGYNFTASNVPLSLGANVIKISAEGTLGETSSDTITIIYDPDYTYQKKITIKSGTASVGQTDPLVTVSWVKASRVDAPAYVIDKGADVWADPIDGTKWISATNNGWYGEGTSEPINYETFHYKSAFILPAVRFKPAFTVIFNADDTGQALLNGNVFGDVAEFSLDTRKTSFIDDETKFETGANDFQISVFNESAPTGVDFMAEMVYDEVDTNILLPTTGKTYSYRKYTINLSGTTSDASDMETLTWKTDKGKKGICVLVGSDWTANNIPIVVGKNVITINAITKTGKGGHDTLDVIFDNVSPQADSTSPNSGKAFPGIQKTFTSAYSDADGAADIQYVKLLVNTGCSANGAAYFVYRPGDNKFYIRDNADANIGVGVTPGTAFNLESDNAILDCKNSTVTKVGNTVTVNWKVTFKSLMLNKSCILYMFAADNQNASSGWVNKGSIKIEANAAPTLGTVTPNSGKALVSFQKTFISSYSDTNGAEDIQYVKLLINDKLNANGAAYLVYKPCENKFYIRDNADANIGVGVIPGTSTNLESDNAILDCKNSTVSKVGNTVTVTWKVTFKSTLAGKTCAEYLSAADNQNAAAAWANKGSIKIENNAAPTLGFVTPSTGSFVINVAQTFSSTYSDVNGVDDIQYVKILINDKCNANGAANLVYKANENKFYIKNNADAYFSAGVYPGTASYLESDNAILDCLNSSVSKVGNTLTVNWKITFKSTLAGKTCFEFLNATDMQNASSGWANKGTIKITN